MAETCQVEGEQSSCRIRGPLIGLWLDGVGRCGAKKLEGLGPRGVVDEGAKNGSVVSPAEERAKDIVESTGRHIVDCCLAGERVWVNGRSSCSGPKQPPAGEQRQFTASVPQRDSNEWDVHNDKTAKGLGRWKIGWRTQQRTMSSSTASGEGEERREGRHERSTKRDGWTECKREWRWRDGRKLAGQWARSVWSGWGGPPLETWRAWRAWA